MIVKLYNSLGQKKEEFHSLEPNKVSMYVCGSTVYDSPHLGNLRPIVTFDVLRRLFIYLGYKVTYVSNFTDVDDKIINRAIKENVKEMDIANRYIDEIKQLIIDINAIKPTYTPRVSEYMDKIIAYIEQLIADNHAYVLDGDVYFKVDSIKNYGELANVNINDLKVGARIEENKEKKSPLDFALWKKTDIGINWPSLWSQGRPGWHTECCVMIDSIFPKGYIDIHGGGFDLKFPHHENEIAQNKASHNNHLARIWMHNGFVTFDNEKMSKSLGNVILAKDAIAKYGGNIVRLVLLSSHYRAPVKVNEETLSMAKNELTRIESSVAKLAIALQLEKISLESKEKVDINPFVSSLADDLNVSNALTYLFEILKDANNKIREKKDYQKLLTYFLQIKAMLDLLGLKIDYPKLSNDDFKLFEEYNNSRLKKDFKKSDEIRSILIKRKLI